MSEDHKDRSTFPNALKALVAASIPEKDRPQAKSMGRCTGALPNPRHPFDLRVDNVNTYDLIEIADWAGTRNSGLDCDELLLIVAEILTTRGGFTHNPGRGVNTCHA